MGNEQWKEDGNCKECRRQKYCSHPCKVKKERDSYEFTHYMLKATGFDKIFEAFTPPNHR